MPVLELYQPLAVSLLLGLLVGLQRERAESRLAGFRTFPLITMLGTASAVLAERFGGVVLAFGFLGLVAVALIGNLQRLRATGALPQLGMTTEVAMLLMFAVGAVAQIGPLLFAVAMASAAGLLLHAKQPLHRLAARMGDEDFKAILQFIIVTFIVLPLVPDRTFGPYAVINPREIWLMVVLIVGIGVGGYVAYKVFGQHAGAVLGGILGGVISSTATTTSYARRAKGSSDSLLISAMVIMIASTVVYVRLMIEISVAAPGFLVTVAPPLSIMLGVSVALTLVTWFRARRQVTEMPPQGNPSEIKTALVFASMYALITLATAAARDYFGESGLYVVAAISGLTDLDAITLATSRLVGSGRLAAAEGWPIIVIAVISNLVFKAGIVLALGSRRLFAWVALGFGLSIATGAILLVFWRY